MADLNTPAHSSTLEKATNSTKLKGTSRTQQMEKVMKAPTELFEAGEQPTQEANGVRARGWCHVAEKVVSPPQTRCWELSLLGRVLEKTFASSADVGPTDK
ncbi:RNA-binding (RRM/RBD/RNP motifs) family protein [Striga asiatica]|uniref:RNA-binding (RRM/RBD/RNP motifs) family protein n=1 Tax=Striga asiatica TaxID=4170 RepID=A0A5A7PWP5_STRAF|nr:RNA-binding (RRM/RBD/RNP motifs) family protein [Striga asiatica]